jgi:hypothetical protein
MKQAKAGKKEKVSIAPKSPAVLDRTSLNLLCNSWTALPYHDRP